MRAYEFITEVISLGGEAPDTKWYTTKDPNAYRNPTVHVGSWTDPTGNQIKSEFRKDSGSPGQTDIRFTRTLPDTHPDYHPAGTMGITGTGKQETPRVLGGVVNNVKTFLDQHPDQKSVVFKSEQPSRTRLYSKMIDRLAPQMGMVGTKVDRDGGAATFQLNRAGEGETHQPISKPREKSTVTKTPPPPPPPGQARPAGINTTPVKSIPTLKSPSSSATGGSTSGRSIQYPITGPMSGGGGNSGAGSMLHQMNPQKLY